MATYIKSDNTGKYLKSWRDVSNIIISAEFTSSISEAEKLEGVATEELLQDLNNLCPNDYFYAYDDKLCL